ncbi:hypothetical protein PR048_030638 [Dryococelus australis]|uniref:HAT C-terminal dimerisation domain-containing protein n=1 Tax=Dryococelus australis TaxID=614101 RepID=A0ABQ9G9H7_9NEOP|nr:hypothetical protein PR048_030638 [Dryococelus australis]
MQIESLTKYLQNHKSNPPSDNSNEYWQNSLIIPYLDSLTSSLNIRFSQENTPAFALTKLHPLYTTNTKIDLWYNLCMKKNFPEDKLKDTEVIYLFNETNIFFPATRKALSILSTIPCIMVTVTRSFSMLRRVKTWLRSTMGEERLTGLCLMSVHRNFVKENHEMVEKNVRHKFSANPRI